MKLERRYQLSITSILVALACGCGGAAGDARSAASALALSSNGAQFVSQGVVPAMVVGQTYLVDVTMLNSGTSTWSFKGSHRLGSQAPQDNQTWGLGRVDLGWGEMIAPGAGKTFSFNVTAPAVAGSYAFQWRMLQEGIEWFGDITPLVNVSVALPPPGTLSPSGTYPAGTAQATLSWGAVAGAQTYSVRMIDRQDASWRDARNNCSAPDLNLCVDSLNATAFTVNVQSGHCYHWWVHDISNGQWSELAFADFCVAAPDTTPPTISFDSPAAGATVSGPATVSATAADNIGVVRVDFLLDGAALRSLGGAPWTFTWDTTGAANGGHTLTANAYDAAGNRGTAQIAIAVQNGTPPSCLAPGPSGGDEVAINALFKAAGAGAAVVLCPNATYRLNGVINFTQPNQELRTDPADTCPARARLVVVNPSMTTAINGVGISGVKVRCLELDGGRGALNYLGGGALIELGGDASGQVVDRVRAYEPRAWSTIHFYEGSWQTAGCADGAITNNDVGPAGRPDGTWADGITLACRNSTVSGNTVTDATDGAIVVFGSSGSTISGNTVRANGATLLGGINLVDYGRLDIGPYWGDFNNVTVSNNTVDAAGAFIKTGIAMGPPIWDCTWLGLVNRGAHVIGNRLSGQHFGYGYVINGVSNFTVLGNTSSARHSGTPGPGCRGHAPPAPLAFQYNPQTSSGTFQPEFLSAPSTALDGIVGVTEGAPPPLVNGAQFVGQSVPASLTPGQSATASVTMRNTGTTTWTAAGNQRLGSQNPQDNQTWGLGRVYLDAGDAIQPGASKTFNFTIRAPTAPGNYPFQWQMLQESVEWFGDFTPSATVSVQPAGGGGPAVAFVAPRNGRIVRGFAPVSASASAPAGIARVVVLIDGVQRFGRTAPPFTWNWYTFADANGAHTLQAVATDANGASNSQTITVYVSN
jgi:parallel beta-helix repeat protein